MWTWYKAIKKEHKKITQHIEIHSQRPHVHTHTYSIILKKLNAFYQNKLLPLLPAKIISSSKYKEKTLNCKENDCIACQHKAAGSPFDHSHTSKNNRKSKGRNNNSSGEKICQFPTGTARRIRVIRHSFGNEMRNGRDGVKYQDEQGPVDTIVL